MQRDAKHTFRIGAVILLFLIIASYAYYQSRKLLEGPRIVIETPQNGDRVSDSLLTIQGRTENINSISLDDRPIFIDEEGSINEKLLLYPGLNIMKFEALDKFGKDKIVMLQVVYDAPFSKPPEPEASSTIAATSTATSTIATSTSSSSFPSLPPNGI
jgi:hypothetical protein